MSVGDLVKFSEMWQPAREAGPDYKHGIIVGIDAVSETPYVFILAEDTVHCVPVDNVMFINR